MGVQIGLFGEAPRADATNVRLLPRVRSDVLHQVVLPLKALPAEPARVRPLPLLVWSRDPSGGRLVGVGTSQVGRESQLVVG